MLEEMKEKALYQLSKLYGCLPNQIIDNAEDVTSETVIFNGYLFADKLSPEIQNNNIVLEGLRHITGDAIFNDSQIQSLPKLNVIGGSAYFNDSQIQSLPELTKIDGWADFDGTKIQSLPKLRKIGWNAYFYNTKLSPYGFNANFEVKDKIYLFPDQKDLLEFCIERCLKLEILEPPHPKH